MMTTFGKIVENHLKTYGSITSMEAINDYGCTRLSAVIFNLRKEGLNIVSVEEESTNRYGKKVRYARYVLGEKND